MNPLTCVSFINTFGDGKLPDGVADDMLEAWILGCDNCQDACPFNADHDWSIGLDYPGLDELEPLLQPEYILKASDEETEINGRGPIISDDELEALYKQLDALTDKDTLILAGSIPSSLPSDMYELIMERLQHKNIRIVVDATKDLLTRVLPYKPFMIKPNNHELSEIFGRPLSTKEDLVEAAKALQEKGAQHVLISMAGDGAILVAADGTVYTSPAPKGTLVNSVGAGDSMVAGFITGFEKTGDLQEALYWGISSGSASAYSENLATLQEVEALLSQVRVN